jgi:hypothetical protein
MEEEKNIVMPLKLGVDTKQIFTLWKPIDNLPKPVYVEAIHDDYEGFRILLRGDDLSSGVLRISFEDKLSYRNTDESYLLKNWNSMAKELAGENFYIIENSSYIDFFNDMTGHLYSDWQIKHYAIYTVSDCIDIISISPPVVEWLD